MKTIELKKIVSSIFRSHGLSKFDADISSNALINAELVGAYGHGLSRLKMYCDRIKKKVINPKPKIKIKKISQSISHIDANNSIGFVAADIGIKGQREVLQGMINLQFVQDIMSVLVEEVSDTDQLQKIAVKLKTLVQQQEDI